MVNPTRKELAITIGLAAPFLISTFTQEYSATFPCIATAVGLAAIDSGRKMSFNMFNHPKPIHAFIPLTAAIYHVVIHFFCNFMKTAANSYYEAASSSFQLSTLSFKKSTIFHEQIKEHVKINASSIDHVWCKAKDFLIDTYSNKGFLELNLGEELSETAENWELQVKNFEITALIIDITSGIGYAILAYKVYQCYKQEAQRLNDLIQLRIQLANEIQVAAPAA